MNLKICVTFLLFALLGGHTMPHGSIVPFSIGVENTLSQHIEETERRHLEEDVISIIPSSITSPSATLWTQYVFSYHSPHLSPIKRPPRNIL